MERLAVNVTEQQRSIEILEHNNINIDTRWISISPCRYESLDNFKRNGVVSRARSRR